MRILDRDQLTVNYEQILSQSRLERNGNSFSIDGKPLSVVLQSTSGSHNKPLLIPRNHSDISDILSRVFARYSDHFCNNPKRVAMIGGISHMEAANAIQIGDIAIKNYQLTETEAMIKWEPELLTCYPSVLRELLATYGHKLAFLKAIKVGGEKLLPSDCKKIFTHFPQILIIEQYGSTELPALAFRSITHGSFSSFEEKIIIPFELQKMRFSFYGQFKNDWHPVIAKDNFNDLIFKLNEYYDTGDEAYCSSVGIIDFRRRSDKEYQYWSSINKLLELDIINCQIDEKNNSIFYAGDEKYNNNHITLNNINFTLKLNDLIRIQASNKLPLMLK